MFFASGTDWGEGGYFRVAQFNPDGDDPLSRGLYGILSEGIIPVRAFNLTEEVFDEPQTVDSLQTWALILIAIAGGLGIGIICTTASKMIRQASGIDGDDEQ